MSIASIMSGTPASVDININDVDFPTITVAGTANLNGLVDISGAGTLLLEHTPVLPGHFTSSNAPFRANVNGWMGLNSGENASVRLIMGPAPSGTNLDYCSMIQATNNFNANYESDLSFWTHGAASTAGDPTKQMEIDDAGDVTILNGALNVNLGLMNAKAGAVIGEPNLVAAPTFSVVAASGTGTVYDSLYNKPPVPAMGSEVTLETYGPTLVSLVATPYTAPVTGWYAVRTEVITAGIGYTWNMGTSYLNSYLEANGTDVVGSDMCLSSGWPVAVGAGPMILNALVKLNAGDVITSDLAYDVPQTINLGSLGGITVTICPLYVAS